MWMEKPHFIIANYSFEKFLEHGRGEDVDEFAEILLSVSVGKKSPGLKDANRSQQLHRSRCDKRVRLRAGDPKHGGALRSTSALAVGSSCWRTLHLSCPHFRVEILSAPQRTLLCHILIPRGDSFASLRTQADGSLANRYIRSLSTSPLTSMEGFYARHNLDARQLRIFRLLAIQSPHGLPSRWNYLRLYCGH